MATRAGARRRAISLARANGRSRGFASPDGGTTALTATSGSGVGNLIDTTSLPPTGAASTWGKGDWLARPNAVAAADVKRFIDSYSGAGRTITHAGPNYSNAPSNGEAYYISKDDPDLWNSAAQIAAAQLLSTIKYDEITLTAQTVRYILSAAPFTLTRIVRASQLMAVEYRDANDAAGSEHWFPWAGGLRTWKAYMDEDDVILDFGDPDQAPDTDVKLRLKWADQYAEPAADSTAVEVDELLWAWGILTQMSEWLADVNNADDDWNIIGQRAHTAFEARRRLVLGPDAFRRVTRTSQQTAIGGVRGRMGRG